MREKSQRGQKHKGCAWCSPEKRAGNDRLDPGLSAARPVEATARFHGCPEPEVQDTKDSHTDSHGGRDPDNPVEPMYDNRI
jgi:hypothetical protein